MKVILRNIREIIWPLLEPIENTKPKKEKVKVEEPKKEKVKVEDWDWKEKDIDLMLNYIEKYSDSEDRRRSQVESKATIFIGIFGVVITVLLNLVKDIIINDLDSKNNINNMFVILVTILSIIYLCRAIWFSIKTLERCKYYSFTFPNFMFDNSEKKKEQIIVSKYNNLKENQKVINLKVDYMTMAQEYFKRAIIIVAGFSILIFIIEIMLKKFNIIEFINNLNTNFVLVILGVLVIILYILLLNIYKKLR